MLKWTALSQNWSFWVSSRLHLIFTQHTHTHWVVELLIVCQDKQTAMHSLEVEKGTIFLTSNCLNHCKNNEVLFAVYPIWKTCVRRQCMRNYIFSPFFCKGVLFHSFTRSFIATNIFFTILLLCVLLTSFCNSTTFLHLLNTIFFLFILLLKK